MVSYKENKRSIQTVALYYIGLRRFGFTRDDKKRDFEMWRKVKVNGSTRRELSGCLAFNGTPNTE